jgi:AcrR family transcriptional regulator
VRGKDRDTAPRALRRTASREALISAAFAIAHRGEDPLDPAALAIEAGVSRPLFYRYFPTQAEFVDELLRRLHAGAAGPDDGAGEPREALHAQAPRGPAEEEILRFFADLAATLDRAPELARALIPRSHLSGPVAAARARRRERAVERIESMLPGRLDQRAERAAFLMDAFLGVQLAWAKGQGPAGEPLADRVGRDMRWAVRGGVLGV